MRKASVLKRVFVMTLVFTILMDNILVMSPAAYADGTTDGDETQATIGEILHDEVPDSTPGKEETVPPTTEAGTEDKNTEPTETPDGGDGETTQTDPDATEESEPEEDALVQGAAAEQSDSSFVVLINSAPAYGLRVDYGQSLSFCLDGHTGSEEVLYFYATPADAADGNWSDITDGVCTLEPGEYRIKYGVTIDQDWKTDDGFSILVQKGTVAGPSGLTWTGSRMSWNEPSTTDKGGTLESGVIIGYKLQVYKNGGIYKEFETDAGKTSYDNFANNIKDDGRAGSYTFTVQAFVDGNNAHYADAAVSGSSSAYVVPMVTVAAAAGIETVTPAGPFLLLPGNAENNSQTITAAVLPGYEFAGWQGEGVSFEDASDTSTVVTINAGYSGAAELTITAKAKDIIAPAVKSFAAGDGGTLTATAYDEHSGVTAYAFSTAADASAVPESEWQAVSAPAAGEASFAHTLGAGGEYYFHAKDGDGNTARSENTVQVTQVTLKDWDPIGETKDSIFYLVGGNNTLPVPVCAGYIFSGWYAEGDFSGTAVTAPGHSTDSPLTLYAKWDSETLSVPAMAGISQVYDAKEHTLAVRLTNTGILKYQWYKDGQLIPGATASSYTVRDVADSGKYLVRVEHYNSRGDLLGQGSEQAEVSITARPVVVAAKKETITYGDALPAFTPDFRQVFEGDAPKADTGLVPGDESSITTGSFACEYKQWDAAKEYEVTASGFDSGNYSVSYETGRLVVSRRAYPDGVSAAIEYANADEPWFVFTGEAIEPTLRVVDTKHDNMPLTPNTDYTATYLDNTGASADKPLVRLEFLGNFQGSVELPFEIRQATFEARTVMAGWTYGEEPSAPSVEGNLSGGEVSFSYVQIKDSDGEAVPDAPEVSVCPTDAGTYRVTASIAGSDNYNPVTAEPCEFTIARRVVTITSSTAAFVFDGLPHSDRAYSVEGDFAAGEGFSYITVTGAWTNVTEGVDNTVEYGLNSDTNPDNYDIRIECGKLIIESVKLTVPSNAAWQSAAPGTATWVAVSKEGLTAQYKLQLYACTEGEYTAVGDEITASGTEYDFSAAIRAHAQNGLGSSYCFTIQTISTGEHAENYKASDVSDKTGTLYTVTVTAAGDENVADAALRRLGTAEEVSTLILLDGESAALSATPKTGYSIMAWTIGQGLTQQGDIITAAKLDKSLTNVEVKALTVDESPEIAAYTAENGPDYTVNLNFTLRDAVGLAGWLIKTDAAVPDAADEGWNEISGTEYHGRYVPNAAGEYYLFAKDTAGNVVFSSVMKAQTGPSGEVIYVPVPDFRGVNVITLRPGAGATGEEKVIFKTANTAVILPDAKACGFGNGGLAFRNWYAESGLYEEGGHYGANINEVLTATWTDQYFDYTVNYFYMNTEGSYPEEPELSAGYNAIYGTHISSDADFLQRAHAGFVLDTDEGRIEQIETKREGLILNVYYQRCKYNLTYRYTAPGQEETVTTVPYFYGQDLSEAFLEEGKPQVTGYTFVGWTFGDSEYMPKTMPASHVTATGEFIPRQGNVYIRFFLEDLEGATYTLDETRSRTVIGTHGSEIAISPDDADIIEGFTYRAAYASFGSAVSGNTMPEEAKETLTAPVVSGGEEEALYLNVFYTRNCYTVTLNVWQGDVGTGEPRYTNNWELPYGADLKAGAVTAEMMESFQKDSWEHDDEYVLAALAAWSTGDRPETMPAGNVTVTRQFVLKISGAFRVEAWMEGETENHYTRHDFTYYNNVATEVTIGNGQENTVDYSAFASLVPDFQYYVYREVTDAQVESGEVSGDGLAAGTVTEGIVTDTNNGESPLILRVFFERKTMTATIRYYAQDQQGNQTTLATATKSSKWGSNYTFNYEVLALFDTTSGGSWNAQPDTITMNGAPDAYDYRGDGYVVSYTAYYHLGGTQEHWRSQALNSVASLDGTYEGPMGVSNTYVNVYYTKVDTDNQYYLDVVYNPSALTYGKDYPVQQLTYTHEGTTYKVRVANEAYFFADAKYVPENVDSRYPGLAYYNNNKGDDIAPGRYVYDINGALKEGFERAVISGTTYYIGGEYIYIPLPENSLFYGHRASYTFPEKEIGNSDVTDFLTKYKEDHAADAEAQGAHVYNRTWGSTISYGNSTLTITFRNGDTYHIYYNVNGNVCKDESHQYAAGSGVTAVGCDHGIYAPMTGYEIVWFDNTDKPVTVPFTINSDIMLYGKYQKTRVTSTEYACYELADHEILEGKEIAYITADMLGSFPGIAVNEADGVKTYTYQGNVVMVETPVVSDSFSELSMDAADWVRPGMRYDDTNPGNRLKGYVEANGITLRAYFQRNVHTVLIDTAIPDTNTESGIVRYGQSYTLTAPSRSGYTFGGWRLTDTAGSPIDASLIKAGEGGSTIVTCPDMDIMATAVWNPAQYSQTVIHYFQNSDRSYDTDLVAEMRAGEDTAASITVSGFPGKKYKNGGISYTDGDRTYYYSAAELSGGSYLLRPENLCAVAVQTTAMQDDAGVVGNGIVNAEQYAFAYAIRKSGKGDIEQLDQNGEYTNAIDMTMEYYYTLRSGYALTLLAHCIGAETPAGVTFTGEGADYYYSEKVTVSVALPAGYEFVGWYESGYSEGSGTLVSSAQTFQTAMTGNCQYVAVMRAKPVSGVVLRVSGVSELSYGYPVSKENAVTVRAEYPDDVDSANYIKAYQWYFVSPDGSRTPVTENGSSATYHIPQGWTVGDYSLVCEVTVARKDNGLESTFRSEPFTVTVEKSAMTVGCTNYAGVYDGAAHTIALNVADLAAGTDYVIYYAGQPLTEENYADLGQTEELKYTDAGSYTVYYYAQARNSNLKDAAGSGTVTITPKKLTVRAGSAVFHRTYDGTDTVSGEVTQEGSDMYRLSQTRGIYEILGLVGADSMESYAVSGAARFNSAHVSAANKLDFTNLKLVSRSTGDVNTNYYFEEDYSINLSAYIDRLPLELAWTNTSLTYNGTAQLPEASIVTPLPAGDSLKLTVSGAQTTAGEYTASANISALGNTDVNDFSLRNGSGNYTIGKIAVTISPVANAEPILYDGLGHTLDTFAVTGGTLLEKNTFTAAADRTEKNAGTHAIAAVNAHVYDGKGLNVTDNYALSYGTAVLTIIPRPVTVSDLRSADKLYDGSSTAAVDCGSVQFQNTVAEDILALDETKITAAFDSAKVGDGKTVTFTVGEGALTGADASNYVLDTAGSSLTATASIKPSVITVTADDVETVYGESAEFKVTYSGFVTGEDQAVVQNKDTLTYKIRTAAAEPADYAVTTAAGTYSILPDVSRLRADNYSFAAAPGKLTVNRRPVTVGAAQDAVITKTYDGTTDAGADSSTFAFGAVEGNAASGVVNGDRIDLTFDAAYNSSNVDEATTVTLDDLGISNANYTLVTTSFTIPGKVTPAELSVQADDKAITYGDGAPAFTVTASGFVHGETAAVISVDSAVYACEYDTADADKRGADRYSIAVSGVTAEHGNYTFRYSDGTLTVNPAVITITAAPASRTAIYGTDPIPSVSFTSAGYKYADAYDTVATGKVTYDLGGLKEMEIDGSKVISSIPGVYTITPIVTGLKAVNYTFAAQGAQLTVDKYNLTITGIKINPRVYDGTVDVRPSQIDFSDVKTDGLLSIDSAYFENHKKEEMLKVTAEYTGNNAQNVGNNKPVSIRITFLDYLNERCYVAQNCQNAATADITPRPLRITAQDQQTLYGLPAPEFTVVYGRTLADGAENPDSGLVPGEKADKSHVTVSCDYRAAGDAFSDTGTYPILVSGFTGSDTALGGNYDPEYASGALTVKQNKLQTPAVSWNAGTPGLVQWNAAPSIGLVSAESYTAALYKDGKPVANGEHTVQADAPLQVAYADLTRSTGAGAYTVKVTANASETNNEGFKNVLSSDPGESAGLWAAEVRFVFAGDDTSQAGKKDISINGAERYVMLAGEQSIPIRATLRNATGYTVKSVTSDSRYLTILGGTDTQREGNLYEDEACLDKAFSGATAIQITLTLASRAVGLKVEVSPRPGDDQASAVYGYGEESRPVLTAKVTPDDSSTTYQYTYRWELQYAGRTMASETHSGTKEASNTWKFPLGMCANTNPTYYTVRCIVTATRDDNGNSYTNRSVWSTAYSYVTNVTINRAKFTAKVTMQNWTYSETRRAPQLVDVSVDDNEIVNDGRYTYFYKLKSAEDIPANWSSEFPTDAGEYLVKAYIPASVNYEALFTEPVGFTIGKTKLSAPTELTMAPSTTAPYGQISWKGVSGVEENDGVDPNSEVTVTYQVKLYHGASDANPKIYDAQPGCSLDITSDLQEGGRYYYTVTALSSNIDNCLDSEESEPFEIIMEGTISADQVQKKYDGQPIVLTAECTDASSYQWYKSSTRLEGEIGKTCSVTHVSESGSYSCVIIASDGTVYTPNITVTITPRSVTMTSGTSEKVYDASALTNHDVAVTQDGFAGNEGAEYAFTGTQTNVGGSKNSFGYTLTGGAQASDYVITTVYGTLTVTPREIEKNGFDFEQIADVVYCDSLYTPTPVVTDRGLNGISEKVLTAGTDYTYSYENNLDAGTAQVTITGKGNYKGAVTLDFAIAKRPVCFTGATGTLTYTGAEQKLTDLSIGGANGTQPDDDSGLVAGHTHNVEYAARGTEASDTPYSGTITRASDVVIRSGDRDVTGNYDIRTVPGSLTIAKTTEAWSVTLADARFTYSGLLQHSDQTPVSSAKTGETTFAYSFEKDGQSVQDLTALEQKDAGTYVIYVTASNPNYEKTAVTEAKLVIDPAVYRVTTYGDTRVYNGQPLTAGGGITGLVNGETVTLTTTGIVTHVEEGAVDNTYEIAWGEVKESNYTLGNKTIGKLSITPATYAVTTQGATREYNGQPLTAGGTITGLVSGETVTLTMTGTITDVGTKSNTYEIEWGSAKASDYTHGTDTIGVLEVTKNTTGLTVRGDSYDAPYDGEAHGSAAAASVTKGTVLSYSTDGGASWTEDYPRVQEVSSVSVMVKAENRNYVTAQASYTLRVTKKPVTITVHDKAKVYGTADPEFTGKVEGLVRDGDLGTVTYYRTNTDVNSAGTYAQVLSARYDENGNYAVEIVKGSFTIQRASTLTVQAEDVHATYDGNPHSTQPVANIPEGTTLTYSTDGGKTYSRELPELTSAGTLTVMVKAENPNYVTAQCSFSLNVAKKAVTITVHDKAKAYGDSDPVFTGEVQGLVRDGDLGTVTYYRTNSGENSAGEYQQVLRASYTENANYDVTVVPGRFTITAADILVISANDVTATYDGKAHGMQPTANIPEGTTLTYSTDGGQTYSEVLPKLTNAGALSVKVKAENPNLVTAFGSYTIRVNPAEVTVTAKAAKKTYGDSDPAAFQAEVTGMVGQESAEELLTYSMSRAAGENVGTYTISFTGDETQQNYHLTFVTGVFTIERRPLALSWRIQNPGGSDEAQSPLHSAVYDGEEKHPVAGFTNLVTRDGVADEVTVQGYSGDLTAQEVGNYHTEITGIAGKDMGNYVLEDRAFDWEITPRPLADSGGENGYAQGIKVRDIEAVVYDGSLHTPEPVVTDALVKGGITLVKGRDYTLTYLENRNAGTAAVRITGKGNYQLSIEKTFTIKPKSVALSWDRDSFDYDAETKRVTAVVTGVVSGDTVTVSRYEGNTAVNRGTYTARALSLGGESARNYTLTGAAGISHPWTIRPARITVRAEDKSSELGAPMQELTYTIVGKVFGKDVPGRFVLSTTAADTAGEFPITVTVEEANPNYLISAEGGVYTLTEAKQLPAGTVPDATTAPADDNAPGEEAEKRCLWHWLIILADLSFALVLLLTMKRDDEEVTQEERDTRKKHSRIRRIIGLGALIGVCVIVNLFGFCHLELPLSVLSAVVMAIASALAYRRKYAGQTETAGSTQE